MKAPQRFETERLILRKPAATDAEEIFRRYAGDRESCHTKHTASQRVLEKCGFRRKQDLVVTFANLPPGEPHNAWSYELVLAGAPP